MKFYLAPMEGITGYIFRNAYYHHFHHIDRYFTPFIPAGKRLNRKVIRDILPEHNQGMELIPQVMSKNARDVLELCELLKEYGYNSININLGCPSATVANKGRGSGFLAFPEELDAFLYEIFEKTDCRVSVKTRLGKDSADGWEHLLEIYRKYPLEELIIHPRIQKDFYKNTPRMEEFALAVSRLEGTDIPICYNGDIVDLKSYERLVGRFPQIDRVMIGRGLLANPRLIAQIRQSSDGGSGSASALHGQDKQLLRSFHEELLREYLTIFSGEKDVLFHMKEIWGYLIHSFKDSDKYWKKIKKCQSLKEYQMIVNSVFSDLELL